MTESREYVIDSNVSTFTGMHLNVMTMTDIPEPNWYPDNIMGDYEPVAYKLESYGCILTVPSESEYAWYTRTAENYIPGHATNIRSSSCAWQAAYMAAAFTSSDDYHIKQGLIDSMPRENVTLYRSLSRNGKGNLRTSIPSARRDEFRDALPEDFLLIAPGIRKTIYSPISLSDFTHNPGDVLKRAAVIFLCDNTHFIALVRRGGYNGTPVFMVTDDSNIHPSLLAKTLHYIKDEDWEEYEDCEAPWCVTGILEISSNPVDKLSRIVDTYRMNISDTVVVKPGVTQTEMQRNVYVRQLTQDKNKDESKSEKHSTRHD